MNGRPTLHIAPPADLQCLLSEIDSLLDELNAQGSDAPKTKPVAITPALFDALEVAIVTLERDAEELRAARGFEQATRKTFQVRTLRFLVAYLKAGGGQ